MNDITNEQVNEVIKLLNQAFNEFGVDFYLIGARARDYWLDANNIPNVRGTFDIDFAVLVADMENFEDLKIHLSKSYNFKLLKIPHRIIYEPYDILIDLIPFGGIEKAGYVSFNDKFDTKFSIIGFKEVYENISMSEISDTSINIATLPGICILKLIAWSDRKSEREKDILDINSIIQHYFDIESEAIYNEHLDLFDIENFQKTNAGARLLGRQMKKIIGENQLLFDRITHILIEDTSNPERSIIGEILVRGTEKTVEDAILPFKELLKGIQV
jgi:predicted nucleotidyltransferase